MRGFQKKEVLEKLKEENKVEEPKVEVVEPPKVEQPQQPQKVYTSLGQEAKEIIEAQPKKTIFFPLKQGEREGSTQRVSINDYVLDVPKGVEVQVPESVYELLRNRMMTEGLISKSMLVDRSPEARNNLV